MKRLFLSGAVLLCAAASCGVARAAWVESNPRAEKSYYLPGSAGGLDTDANWSTSNAAPNSSGDNGVSFNASVRNGRDDQLPLWDSQLSTGASLIKNFTWNQPTAAPTSATVYHTASFSGQLSVSIPAGSDNYTQPAATAKAIFTAIPGTTWSAYGDPENGNYTSVARPNGLADLNDPNRMAATYVYILANGAYRTGQPTRYISGTVTGTKLLTGLGPTVTHSVEVRIKGFTEANGKQIPPGTYLTAQADGSIFSQLSGFVLR